MSVPRKYKVAGISIEKTRTAQISISTNEMSVSGSEFVGNEVEYSVGNAVIIIGASSVPGLGHSIARRFAKAKFSIGIIGRNEEGLRNCAQKIREEWTGDTGLICAYRSIDVKEKDKVRYGLEDLLQELKGPHADVRLKALIYNASGKPYPLTLLEDVDFSRLVYDYHSAVVGFSNVIQWCLPKFVRWTPKSDPGQAKSTCIPGTRSCYHEKIGTIIVTGSKASTEGMPHFASFCAAKAALRSLSFSLAKECLHRGIHVAHVLIDGVINNELLIQALSTEPDYLDHPGFSMAPEHIANVYWFLYKQPIQCPTLEMDLRSPSSWAPVIAEQIAS